MPKVDLYVIVSKTGKVVINSYGRPHVYLRKKEAEEIFKSIANVGLSIVVYSPQGPAKEKVRDGCRHERQTGIYCPDCGRSKRKKLVRIA